MGGRIDGAEMTVSYGLVDRQKLMISARWSLYCAQVLTVCPVSGIRIGVG